MKKIIDAMRFAETKHEGQARKGSGDPYVTHTVAVSYILASVKQSKNLEDLLVACILHDTLEDTNTTFDEISKRFGSLVASLVLELTNDESEIERVGKLEYHKKKLVGISSYALLIKLADRLHNISDNPSEKMVVETRELIYHLMGERALTKSQLTLANRILKATYNAQV